MQLQQVLMNLMLNGMEAMRERGGELKISTRREGDEVMVSVRDTGVGIPTDKMEQIFNAFVTTKAGGTGMGLRRSAARSSSRTAGGYGRRSTWNRAPRFASPCRRTPRHK